MLCPIELSAHTDGGGLEPQTFDSPNRLAAGGSALLLHHPNGGKTNRTPSLSAPLGFKPSYRPFRSTLQCAQKKPDNPKDRPVLCFHVSESTQQSPDGPKTVDYSIGMIAGNFSFLLPHVTYTQVTVFLSTNGGNKWDKILLSSSENQNAFEWEAQYRIMDNQI